MKIYLDTSAAFKLIVNEAESPALVAWIDEAAASDATLISSFLLETELRRACVRTGLEQVLATELLSRIDLVEPDRALFAEAGVLAGEHLRTLDALHVATAMRVGADMLISYDERQTAAAAAVGLRSFSPS